MSKKHRRLLTKADIKKQYRVSEHISSKLLPRPEQYLFRYGQRIPAWDRMTVQAAFSSPAAQKYLEAARKNKTEQQKAALRKMRQAEAVREHLLRYDISSMIAAARQMRRHFVVHCGPTNSGKTYQSLQALQASGNGCYLGPLRLLALEMFDTLNNQGVPCSLLTGEERIDIPFAGVTASTIEMCDFRQQYETAVIDEAQLLTDRMRGGHWLNAILRIRAREVHICVAPEGLRLVEDLLKQIGDPYEVIHHQRLTPLNYAGVIPANEYGTVEPGDALIAFSRKAVLAIAAELESCGIHASVIYGALPPQSRREEVRKFAAGENTVVVATDAIGMGVSLPIRRVIFCQTSKFDGTIFRPLTATEIKQIAGRAGRFGKYDEGLVLTMEAGDLIRSALETQPESFDTVVIPFPKEALDGEFPLAALLEGWQALPAVSGFTYEDMSEARLLYGRLERKLGPDIQTYPAEQILRYITCPVDTGSPKVVGYWTDLAIALLNDWKEPKLRLYGETLEDCEVSYKRLDVRHQMMTRAGRPVDVTAQKRKIEERINELLNEDKAAMKRVCTRCGKPLEPTARFNTCERCWEQERA